MYESADLAGERDTPRAVVYTTLYTVHYTDTKYGSIEEEKTVFRIRIGSRFQWVSGSGSSKAKIGSQ
jgi:hypothetical protein